LLKDDGNAPLPTMRGGPQAALHAAEWGGTVARGRMPMTRIFAAASAAAAVLLAASAAEAGDLIFFRTPSGNIHCLAYDAEAGNGDSGVACEIHQIAKRTLNVKRPADCDLEWGNRVELGQKGRAGMSCYGDTLASPDSRVLAYGRTFEFGAITCGSNEAGLECSNSDGHGFFLSRARQRLF
jgi:hypothetical protein